MSWSKRQSLLNLMKRMFVLQHSFTQSRLLLREKKTLKNPKRTSQDIFITIPFKPLSLKTTCVPSLFIFDIGVYLFIKSVFIVFCRSIFWRIMDLFKLSFYHLGSTDRTWCCLCNQAMTSNSAVDNVCTITHHCNYITFSPYHGIYIIHEYTLL